MARTAYGKAPWGKSPYGGEEEELYSSDPRPPVVGTATHELTRTAVITQELTRAGTIGVG